MPSPVDPGRVLAAAPRERTAHWEHKDVLLYHLGLGAGPGQPHWTLEDRLRVLPSFATVAGGADVLGALDVPGLDLDLARVLHGSQAVEIHRPLPPAGTARTRTRITEVHDKGSAAVFGVVTEAADATGPLWTARSRLFARSAGGFGGERGPAHLPAPPPPRAPEAVRTLPVREDAALLYRLCGDWNPLHSDPAYAARAGFGRPVLQGLCTYGMTLRSLVDTLLAGRPERVRRYAARFTGVVYPGDHLSVRMWRDAGAGALTETGTGARAEGGAGPDSGAAAGRIVAEVWAAPGPGPCPEGAPGPDGSGTGGGTARPVLGEVVLEYGAQD
ncbi:MaoC/PaaZ C-terminal domain-containing protein [Streptomyces sp. NPDC007088]|uniref:MaoC/PaaZ C-terminal domain-containing protein n=1 Tax=Streptomyces sp. NPDC007088 TaxID=3364773 RepID=UPI0036988B41